MTRQSGLTSQDFSPPLINIGCGQDLTIRELSETGKEVVGFDGVIVFDTGEPDGIPCKLLDVSRLQAMGWQHDKSLIEGLRQAYTASHAIYRCVFTQGKGVKNMCGITTIYACRQVNRPRRLF